MGSLINFCSHIEGGDAFVVRHHQRIDFHVHEVEVSEKLHKCDDETGKIFLSTLRNMCQQNFRNRINSWLLTDSKRKTNAFRVDVAYIYPAFMIKQNLVVVAKAL